MMLNWIKHRLYRIKTILRWLPIIYKDYQWDQYYLFKLLAFKFKLMEEHYRSKYACAADSERQAKQIQICKYLCERLSKEDYTTPWDKEIKNMTHKEPFINFIDRLRDNKLSKREHNILRWSDEYEEIVKKQDLELLCNLIQKHAFTWWD